MVLTLESLITAIRSSADLRDLKRLVGPSAEELEASRQRLAQLDALAPACQFGQICPGLDAQSARDRYRRIERDQAIFENQHC